MEAWQNAREKYLSKKFANPLSDVVRALQKLKPRSEADLLTLLRLLGYGLKHQVSARPAQKTTGQPTKKERPVSDRPSTPDSAPERRFRKPFPSEFEILDMAQHAPPDWLRTVPHLEEATPTRINPQIPMEPLFHPNWMRAILSDALSTPGFGDEIDIERIIQKISASRPLTELPRRQVPTMIRGVQLLVDCSEAMEPFARDQAMLKSALYSVVGRDKTQIRSFHGTPLLGSGSGLRDEWKAYDPVPPGTPILVLTDLGIGNPGPFVDRADARDWLEFADLLREYEYPLIAFVPYPEKRWPEALRTAMTILQWDRPTNSSAVRRRIGYALRVQGG